MKSWGGLAMFMAIAAALALRLPHLDKRPLHNDEAVNAIKIAELWEKGRYAYDPDEYHGPTLHYATLPFLWLSGAKTSADLPDKTLRLAPVIFGAGLILLLPLFRGGLSLGALAWAALFLAVSPAMVFYSRYFIHEMLLVFFTLLTMAAGWQYAQHRGPIWAVIFGAGVGLMFATKETFVLTLGAFTLAFIPTALFSKQNFREIREEWFSAKILKHWGMATGAGLVIWFLFFTSFFQNFAGPLDSIKTYLPWLKRAGGHSPHIHEWSFYLERLFWFQPAKSPLWSEALVGILAVIGGICALRGKSGLGNAHLQRFILFYTIFLLGIYCTISYKTPWCLLNFYLGMILLAGLGASWILKSIPLRCTRAFIGKTMMVLILLALTGQLGWQAWRGSHEYSSDRRNPYVYAQTLPDLLNLVQRAEGLAAVSPDKFEMVVKVISPQSDYWPLPWYLRKFKNVGWYEKVPDEPLAPVMVVESKLDSRLDEKSDRKWIMAGFSELRPGKFLELYVELELWKKYVETLPRPVD